MNKPTIKKILLISISLLLALPIIVVILLSLSKERRYPDVLGAVWSLDAWRLIGQNTMLGSLFLSLGVAILVATVATILGYGVSRWIAYHRFSEWLGLLPYLPFVLSPVVYGACLQYYFVYFGASGKVWGVLLAQLLITFPYTLIFFSAFWHQRIKELEQLVVTLGGSEKDIFFRLLFPISRKVLTTCFFQTFLISWFEYGLTNLIGVGKIQTLPLKVFQFVGEANIFYAATASSILIIPPLLLLWFNKKYILDERQQTADIR